MIIFDNELKSQMDSTSDSNFNSDSDSDSDLEEFKPGPYIELKAAEVPRGWTNDPRDLPRDGSCISLAVHPSYFIPDPKPMLHDGYDMYVFSGGDAWYYAWAGISGAVWRIDEPSLPVILKKLRRGLQKLPLTLLRACDGPSGEPDSTVPFRENPHFVNSQKLATELEEICRTRRHAMLLGPACVG
jgi:hypothetical protein